MRTQFTKLIKQVRKNIPGADVDVLRRAYRVANKAHEGQERLSGDPFIMHCIEVARNLASLRLDTATVAAGLLHDVLEDTPVTPEELEKEFGPEIATLVEGVTKIGALSFPGGTTSQEEKQAVNLRKMLVATARDVRVILIKLADRLHNMRTIEFLPDDAIRRISRETRDIYAPLAHRLGIARWKWELEDHAFHQLNPQEYKELASRVAMKRREREARLKETCAFLEERLAEAKIKARVIGRPKHLFSIYQKMLQQGKDFDQVMDVQAVRIISESVGDCYNALGVVHHLWTPVPGRFKDYIAMPKLNMYQSIHTTMMRENGMPLEIQIRTEEMDKTAREGIAAHWVYKEVGQKPDRKLDGQLRWLRQMYDWLQETHAPDELLDSLRRDVSGTDVYVFTPKGEVKELPAGATPLDFAYLIHSEVGDACIGARVHGRIVPLRYNLQTGDMVEIITSKTQVPRLDWLDIVVTGRARTKIRQRLRELGDLEPLPDADDGTQPPPQPKPKPEVRAVDDATRDNLIRIEGAKGIVVQFAKCCNPMPGEPVFGYATKSTGVTIHRRNCKNFARTDRDPKRVIEAGWAGQEQHQMALRVAMGQRPNVLADITNAIRPMNITITAASFMPDKNGKSHFDFVFETEDPRSAERVAATLRTVEGVASVGRLNPRQVGNNGG